MNPIDISKVPIIVVLGLDIDRTRKNIAFDQI